MRNRVQCFVTVVLFVWLGYAPPVFATQNSFGSYVGELITRWLDDGRKVELTQDFSYVTPAGVTWTAPAGSVVDGASIPRWAWAIIGGPLDGPYRKASVIHDVACDTRNAPWQQVHKTFYTAMRASGVDKLKAKTMYAAVYYFGPRWERRVHEVVPVKIASARAFEISNQVLKGEYALSSVFVIHAQASPCEQADCSYQPTSVTDAQVSVEFVPEQPTLTQPQFAELQRRIEGEDMTLEDIENFATMEPHDSEAP